MSKCTYLIFLIMFTFGCEPNESVRSSETPNPELSAIIEDDWDFRMKEFPRWATSAGIYDQNDKLGSVTVADQERRKAYWQELLSRLEAIDPATLSPADQINHEMLIFILKDDIARVDFQDYLIPLDAEGGFYSYMAFLPRSMPLETKSDIENYTKRLAAIGPYFDQHIELMELGLEKGMTLPRILLDAHLPIIDRFIVNDPAESQLYTPFENLPERIPEEEAKELAQAGREVISEIVIPAYRRVREFMEANYLPGARTTLGATSLPNGANYYQQRINFFTTLPYSAEDIFEIGQKEVARIRSEMEAIIAETGFEGSFEEFFHFLRTDPQFYAETPEELLKEAAFLAKKIDGRLPQVFGKLPRLPYGVEPVPAAIAPNYTGGRYAPGSVENHRAGEYWVNTYKLDSRPLYVLPSLTLHEAVPGHHLQHSLSLELEGLPEFRKQTYLSCYGEGWGLYAEYLGQELGIYATPYDQFGRLTYEMWRACRLVVDVGLHAKGWTRQQAVDFLAGNSALSLHEVNTEIDRYIGWPGQAISYKIGELKIRELRQRAEEAMGENFDIRDFHDLILSNGSVPLFTLERLVDNYIGQ